MGLAAGIVAFIFIQHELSYDTFHSSADRIYRILRERGQADRLNIRRVTSGALARAAEADFPQIEMASKSRMYTVDVREGRRVFPLRQCHIDEHFLDLFHFRLLRGSRATVFADPYSIVITGKTAELFFGDGDPVGRKLTLGG